MSIVLKLRVDRPERILRGQSHYWQCMRALHATGQPFSVSAIYAMSNTRRENIRKFIVGLVSHGYVAEDGEALNAATARSEKLYRIVRDQAACPRVGKGTGSTGQQHMWNLLRGPMARDGITARDLAAFASTDELPIRLETAKAYLTTLSQAGYLSLCGRNASRQSIWRLKPAMNTGPLPPMILRSKLVYDQNAGKVMGDVIAEEEGA